MTHLVLHVEGMSCGHCITAVTRALEEVPGVLVHSVDLGTVQVNLEVPGPAPDDVIAALAAEGYPATVTSLP